MEIARNGMGAMVFGKPYHKRKSVQIHYCFFYVPLNSDAFYTSHLPSTHCCSIVLKYLGWKY